MLSRPITTALAMAGLTPERLRELAADLMKGEGPFARLMQPSGEPFYVRRDMVAAFGRFQGRTHLVLVNEDIDYEVKETPEQVLRLIEGENQNGSLTNQHSCGTLHARRRNQNGVESRSKSKAAPAERGGQGPEAVQPLERDAPPVL